jgi:hypothetical protein
VPGLEETNLAKPFLENKLAEVEKKVKQMGPEVAITTLEWCGVENGD